MDGLKQKYNIEKTNGKDIDPKAKYFVLRYDLDQKDKVHANACREALMTYAKAIEDHMPQLSEELIDNM